MGKDSNQNWAFRRFELLLLFLAWTSSTIGSANKALLFRSCDHCEESDACCNHSVRFESGRSLIYLARVLSESNERLVHCLFYTCSDSCKPLYSEKLSDLSLTS